MSYPTKYTRQYDYVSYQNANPNRPLPAGQIHADFNQVARSTAETIDFLKRSLRSDGQIANGAVGLDQLDPTLATAGLKPADPWASGVAYTAQQSVVAVGSLYRCLIAHTSTNFAADLAAGKWLLITALVAGPAGPGGDPGPQGDEGPQGNAGPQGPGYGGTSTTSLLIANSVSKVFTTQPGLAYQAGSYVRASSAAAGANFMEGTVTSYVGGALTLAVTNIGGSGTFADWTFAVAGAPGSVGVSSIASNTGAFTLGAGLTNSTNALLVDPTYLRGYISGLTLSNDAVTPNTILDIAAGVATSDDQAVIMKLSSAYTKTTGSWAVGSTNGALDTGTVANSTWYHVFQIQRPDTGVVDILFSTSATAPTMPTNYTKKRRIGSFKTNSSAQIIAFLQFGNEFVWAVPVNDYSLNYTTNDTTAKTPTLSVPTGVSVRARFWFYLQSGENARRTALITSPNQPDTAASAGLMSSIATASSTNTGVTQGEFNVWANTSGQIRFRMDGGSASGPSVFIDAAGWYDPL